MEHRERADKFVPKFFSSGKMGSSKQAPCQLARASSWTDEKRLKHRFIKPNSSRYSLVLLISIALIFAMGILMVFDTTAAEVLDRDLDQSPHHAVIKQLIYALFAGFGAFAAWRIGYQNIIKMSGLLLVLATILLILVFVPGIGQQINGAHRWIRIFGTSLQPSEFAKFLIPLYYIRVMTSEKKPQDFKSFLILLSKLALPIGLILIEPDNGTVAIIVMALIALFVLTKVRWIYWALPLLMWLMSFAL